MFYIRAYTFMYVFDTSCTYTIRSALYVVRILHVFASIIENIHAHTADRMLIYTYAHTCIYVLSGSLMAVGRLVAGRRVVGCRAVGRAAVGCCDGVLAATGGGC